MKMTCSDSRCPQPISLDEFGSNGRCYFHGKVEAGLIVDRYDGPLYDEASDTWLPGALIPVTLP
jgi:hypothetical protein